MLTKRIIACLDVDAGRVVKGTQFLDLRDAGDPAVLAAAHSAAGADEVVLLDITATHEKRNTLLETVRRTAKELFIPFTVGGGFALSMTPPPSSTQALTRSASTPPPSPTHR